MAYPTQDEIRLAAPLLPWIDKEFLRLDPFAFVGADFSQFVYATAEGFDVDPNGVYCVGSGAVGLSLSPKKMLGTVLKAFDASENPATKSDLDIAIISQGHFETAWKDLKRATQPTLDVLDASVEQFIGQQRARVFDGAILANKLLPAISFGPEWASASNRLSERIARMLDREVDVNFWIYRDYWSVRNYVSKGIVECRRRMT